MADLVSTGETYDRAWAGHAPVTDEQIMGALRRLRRQSGVSLAFGGLLRGTGGLRLQYFDGQTAGALDGLAVDMGHGLGGRVASVSRPMVVDDYLHTPHITHRYNTIIAREGLRAMAAAPVIVDRRPVAVIYGALHSADPIGNRALDALAMEARTLEQEIVAARASLETAAGSENADRDRLTEVFARLRVLAREVDDDQVAAALAALADDLVVDTASAGPTIRLSGREQDVLALAALGYPNARIASTLGITVETAKSYVKDAMRKLGAANRLEAVVIARRHGLLP